MIDNQNVLCELDILIHILNNARANLGQSGSIEKALARAFYQEMEQVLDGIGDQEDPIVQHARLLLKELRDG